MAAAAAGQRPLSVTAHASAAGLASLGFPPGTTINGSFESPTLPGVNLFVSNSNPPYLQVPAGSGNSNGPNNVEISGGTAPEFATTLGGGYPFRFDASVNVNLTGLVTYSVQWGLQGPSGFTLVRPNITLISGAFLGCRLSPAGPNTFPAGTGGGGQFNNTVTGSLQSNMLQLMAAFLANDGFDNAPPPRMHFGQRPGSCPTVPR